jgi:small-conductance mechanosensitive channel
MQTVGSDVIRVAVPLAVAGGIFVLGLVVRRLVVGRLYALARRTESDWDDMVLRVLRGPVVLWLAIFSLAVAAEFTGLSGRTAALVQRTLVVLIIASITWVAARIAGELVGRAMAPAGGRLPATSLVENVVRGVVIVLGGLVILQTLGISIVPIVTALGVGGLAVALALQDTLANFFAGLHILATRKIRPGDFIRLDSGEEGHVEDITWRHTTILQTSNVVTIVPNAKLAAAVTTNYSLPESSTALVVRRRPREPGARGHAFGWRARCAEAGRRGVRAAAVFTARAICRHSTSSCRSASSRSRARCGTVIKRLYAGTSRGSRSPSPSRWRGTSNSNCHLPESNPQDDRRGGAQGRGGREPGDHPAVHAHRLSGVVRLEIDRHRPRQRHDHRGEQHDGGHHEHQPAERRRDLRRVLRLELGIQRPEAQRQRRDGEGQRADGGQAHHHHERRDLEQHVGQPGQ